MPVGAQRRFALTHCIYIRPFRRLLGYISTPLGYCGSFRDGRFVNVTDLLPVAGRLTGRAFARLVLIAEGFDPDLRDPDTKRQIRMLDGEFVRFLGDDVVDVDALHCAENSFRT